MVPFAKLIVQGTEQVAVHTGSTIDRSICLTAYIRKRDCRDPYSPGGRWFHWVHAGHDRALGFPHHAQYCASTMCVVGNPSLAPLGRGSALGTFGKSTLTFL